jgi:hypothetical protein
MQACSSVIRFHANIRARPLGSKHRKPINSAPGACVGMTFSLRRVLDALVWFSAHRQTFFLTSRCQLSTGVADRRRMKLPWTARIR